MSIEIIVKANNLSKHYMIKKGIWSFLGGGKGFTIKAVDQINFEIMRGEIFGLAGESGSGKTTTGRMLALLEKPTYGSIIFEGTDLASLKGKELKHFRRKVQMIFQDPYESLDPRLKIYDSIYEALAIHSIGSSKQERTKIIKETLENVGLSPPEEFLNRYPHELSGGQRQRASIARAIVLKPKFIIADEPVSMIDTSVCAGILNLMMKLRSTMNVTYIFITHDLAIARYICDRLAIMYQGKIRELGHTEDVINKPLHPYTKILLSSVPIPDPGFKRQRIRIPGEWDIFYNQMGCKFHGRCPNANEKCTKEEPELREILPEHWVACHLYAF
ncbi:ABC transporter ATP-binding protein [Candidatus Bathyarchaeota archaeon]|nr:ABC transporter ATP-binding protein [Candidatus Bathyarchaeota archaeon]